MILEKLKQLFSRSTVPEEMQSVFASARSVKQLLTSLDELLRQNSLERAKVVRETDEIEKAKALEEKKIAEGRVLGRMERNTLSRIRQLESRLTNLDRRVRIYDRNIELQNNLIAKIQDVQAMQLNGVDEKQIEDILVEWEERFDDFMRVGEAARALAGEKSSIEEQEREELARLKEKIMAEYGETKPRRKKAREKEVVESAAPPSAEAREHELVAQDDGGGVEEKHEKEIIEE